MNMGPREHLSWDEYIDEEIPCIHDWDGNYPGQDDEDTEFKEDCDRLFEQTQDFGDDDTPYMFEDDTPEVTTLDDDMPF